MRLQWNLLSAPNAAKTFQARVDRVTTERLLAIQRAEGWTDSELVQHALELVIDEADRNLAIIIDKADAIICAKLSESVGLTQRRKLSAVVRSLNYVATQRDRPYAHSTGNAAYSIPSYSRVCGVDGRGSGGRLIENPARAPARLRHRAVSLPIGLLSRMVVA
jgi:hypothetical protein